MNFSKRYGYKEIRSLFQKEELDYETRVKLWNIFYKYVLRNDSFHDDVKNFREKYWIDFSNEKISEMPHSSYDITKHIEESIFERYRRWWLVFDLIEFSLVNSIFQGSDYNDYKFNINEILKAELTVYRIVDNQVVEISDDIEIESLENALNTDDQKNSLDVKHLKESLKLLSNRENPDYRNSIKESISAIESICRNITGENTLGKAIKKLEKSGIEIHQQLKNALEKLYLYTNDKETGIRHALIEDGYSPDFDEAKFMLVTCSAFINYLKSKHYTP